MRAGKGAAQGYSDFYKRNSFTKPSGGGESKSVSTPEARNPFQVSIQFGSTPFRPGTDDEDERKAALRRRLKRRRAK